MNKYSQTLIRILAVAACFSTGSLRAATLDATTSLASNTTAIPLQGGTQNVVRINDGAAFYHFGDRNADGTFDDAVSPPGLALGSFNLTSGLDTRHINLNLNGGGITAVSGALSTSRDTNFSTSGISLFNVGTISLGDGYIQTKKTDNTGNGSIGSITIGQNGIDGPRAGSIQAAWIDASSGGGISGNILIHSTGNVFIQNSSSVAGNLWSGFGGDARSIQVFHEGTFVAGDIRLARGRANAQNLAAIGSNIVQFDGAVVSGAPTGSFTATSVDTHSSLSSGATANRDIAALPVSIARYTSVTLDSVVTYTESLHGSWRNTGKAGNISITGITDNITITGTVNASSNASGNPFASRGSLTLQAGGKITLAGLDLANVGLVTLDAGEASYIQGELLGFNTGSPGTSGLTTAFSNQTIYYDKDLAANSYLGGATYTLASFGQLMPNPVPEPATWALLAIGGLALVLVSGARKRNRTSL